MSGPEQRVADACIAELKRRHILSINLNGSNGDTGLPDRLALIGHGRVLALEFKAPRTGRLGVKQEWVHAQWRDAGIDVLVVDDVRVLREWLDALGSDAPTTKTTGRVSPTRPGRKNRKVDSDVRKA